MTAVHPLSKSKNAGSLARRDRPLPARGTVPARPAPGGDPFMRKSRDNARASAAAGQDIPPAPPAPDAPPLLASCDFVPQGDGSYRAVPRRPKDKVTVREAARLANCPRTSIYLLYKGGFIAGERQSPRKIMIDVESLRAHLEAIRHPDFWTRERRARYWTGVTD